MDTLEKFQAELERCSLLSGFTTAELTAFLDRAIFESFGQGEEILTEGKLYQGIWLIVSGRCEVVKRGPQRDSRLAILEPGHVFGEMSFLQAVPHSASVRALDRVETVRLMRQQYEELRECCPSAAHRIAANIVRVLSDRLRKMDEWTCELVEKECDGRRHEEWKEFRSKLYTDLFE